jgi:hypothetical protein
MQTADLFAILKGAYKAHISRVVNALDLTHDPANRGGDDPLSGLIDISLDSVQEQRAFLERFDQAEKDFAQLAANRERMGIVRGDGFDAGKKDQPKSANPYMPMQIEHLFWYRGWCQARNVMPVSEIPMRTLFEMDRPVTRFKKNFRIDELLDKLAAKLCASEHPEFAWSQMTDVAKKPYLVMAVSFLEVLMDRAPLALPAPTETAA